MAKFVVHQEEYWPFCALEKAENVWEGSKNGIELPAEFVEQYERVMTEFEQLQSELRRLS